QRLLRPGARLCARRRYPADRPHRSCRRAALSDQRGAGGLDAGAARRVRRAVAATPDPAGHALDERQPRLPHPAAAPRSQTMTPSAIADSIVNLCGAIGLMVAAIALYRRDPGGPFTRRLIFLLGVVAALFFIRGLAWWHESAALDRLSLIPAATVP